MKAGKSQSRKVLCEPLECRTLLSTTPLVVGYLPDYEFSHFSSIDLGALSEINYFSIVANSAGTLSSTSASGYSLTQLQTVVTAAHNAPSRVSVSITIDPSSSFLAIAQSSTATTAFVNNVISFCSTYHLDGVDLDYEPGTLTTAQKNSYGSLLAALHAQTSANGLVLSAAVQVSQMIVPQADLSDIDRYFVMAYDLDFNSSAPYSESIAYLTNWANYGVPKADLFLGVPFYGRSGTSWSNSTTETYAQILSAYASANQGDLPSPTADSVTINGTTWGYNGVATVQEKAQYVTQNGYGGMMIWEMGQDQFVSGGAYGSLALLPAIKSAFGAASETWIGSASSAWNAASNWNFGAVPVSSTNVVINSGTVTASSAFSVSSLTLNGGTLTLAPVGGTFTTASLAINAGATLDLGNNSLIISYAAIDPIATIRGYLTSGENSGKWNGPGIDSSTAAANPGYALGYADGADGVVSGLVSGQIEVAYTLNGDADLDGVVGGNDFTILTGNLGKAVSGWDKGDFAYNGIVSPDDFTMLVGNLGKNTNMAAVALPATGLSALDAVAVDSTALTTTPSALSSPVSKAHLITASWFNDQRHQALARKRPHA